MQTREYTNQTGKLKTFHLENEIEEMVKIPNNKPSRRLISTKKGKRAIAGLIDVEANHNHSWYEEIKLRAAKDPKAIALFYRGTKITFEEMLNKADIAAASLKSMGVEQGDEIPACLSNIPETVYLLLAINKIGAKINLMGNHFEESYLTKILDGCTNKVFLATDDCYEGIKNLIQDRNYNNIVLTSLADSLPEDPTKCDEYEPTLDKYYHYDNRVGEFKNENAQIIDFNQFLDMGNSYNMPVESVGDLDSEFLTTYTSGSTLVGYPSQIVHTNRSLIVSGRFHDSELSGNPDLKGLRGMAHIHTESNTDVITCISDNLMQLWSVAMEPEYSKETALDTIFINKPNYLNMTTSFLVRAFKQYLIEGRYNENGVPRKMPWLFACFAVGEGTSPGEEKFINKGMKIAKAGSGVKIKGFSLSHTTLSVGGGDCEHGGIYYTLWKALFDKLNYFKLNGDESGMMPESYVQVGAFKQLEDGTYQECDYGQYGIIASNSATTMQGYKNNPDKTNNLIITDAYGRDWVSNNVIGYIDNTGGVHVKGRAKYMVPVGNVSIYPFIIEDVVKEDADNILSCTVCRVPEGYTIVNIEFQPDKQVDIERVMTSFLNRFQAKYSFDIAKYVLFRFMSNDKSYPLSGAGKRSVHDIEALGLTDTVAYDEFEAYPENHMLQEDNASDIEIIEDIGKKVL